MSIEICNKCTVHIDTDYDTETIVYQKDTPLCRSCAVDQCFFYSIRDLNASYWNTWKSGFEKALTQDDAIEQLTEKYQIENTERDLKLRHDGSWSSFINTNNRLGWD